ncbi:hypothetical protein GQX73_g7587 [Xylaria multiplex]|uniref:catechol O-methyltransferase n=1 Tax=Xylaria multiplex TaxID=323545 RepID=A0A7C8MQ52_9PEZI|nr:hypothetical protein GQX73_g7587 [Xylaria multiplex]
MESHMTANSTSKTPTVWDGVCITPFFDTEHSASRLLFITHLIGWQDGRELAVLNHILSLPNLDEIRGEPQAILEAIEKWSQKNQILMVIGPERGRTILDLISETKPKTMVELGGYIGYSAIKFGSAVKAVGGQRYLSFESNAEYASIAQKLIDLAGLNDFVHITVGPSTDSLNSLARQNPPGEIDILFLDHPEHLYVSDLKLCEDSHLLNIGSYVVADNVGGPGAQEYVSRVEGRAYATEKYRCVLADGDLDAMTVSKRLE